MLRSKNKFIFTRAVGVESESDSESESPESDIFEGDEWKSDLLKIKQSESESHLLKIKGSELESESEHFGK